MPTRIIAWLIFLAALWAPSFLLIKIAVRDIPPVTLAALRVSIGCLALFFLIWLRGIEITPVRSRLGKFFVLGTINHAIPFIMFNWGQSHVDSAVGSILNGTVPIFTIVIAHFLIADDRLTATKVWGGLVGIAGLVVLVYPELAAGAKASFWGSIAMTGAAFCYAVSIIYSRMYFRGLPQLLAPTAQLFMASLVLIPLSVLVDQPWHMPVPSVESAGAMLVLGLVSTAIAFVVYYHLLELTTPSTISTVTYIIPVFGIILGITVMNESLSWNAYAGGGLILVGVMIINDLWGILRRSYGPARPRDESG